MMDHAEVGEGTRALSDDVCRPWLGVLAVC
jgi:hypothetical protein